MLIAIEGVDKSGKETQTALLLERLRNEKRNARKIEFPNYQSEAAGAVRMYLNGDFGANPDDVNPYAASVFFAVDRYASYRTDWGAFIDGGGIVVADRYTMSNMIHQGVKFSGAAERRKYIEWLIDLEFVKIGLPKPDIVIFLDLSMELREKLLAKPPINDALPQRSVALPQRSAELPQRSAELPQKSTGQPHIGADIHERDLAYLYRSHICAGEIAAQLGWRRIDVGKDGAIRPIGDIHEEIYAAVAPLLDKI